MNELRDLVKKLEQRVGGKPASKPASLEADLKGRAVELWSTQAGRLFLVADEEDAHELIEHFGARRGEIYTAVEMKRIVAVNDPAVVAEIHDWKREFDGTVREYRSQGGDK